MIELMGRDFLRNSGLKNHVIDDDYIEGGCYKLQAYETSLSLFLQIQGNFTSIVSAL